MGSLLYIVNHIIMLKAFGFNKAILNKIFCVQPEMVLKNTKLERLRVTSVKA
jgi:hypothetical protein